MQHIDSNCEVSVEDESTKIVNSDESCERYKEKLKRCSKSKNQFIAALIASFGPFLDTVISPMLAVQWAKIPEGQSTITASREEVNYLMSIAILFCLIGPVVNTYLIVALGRKWTICATYIPQIVACTLFTFGSSFTLFWIGCVLALVNSTFNGSMAALHISEFAAPHLRGFLCSIMSGLAAIGMLSGYILAMLPLNQAALIVLVAAVIFFLLALGNLESPYYLLNHGRLDETRRCLTKIYHDEVVESELTRLIKATSTPTGAKTQSRGWSWSKFKQPAYQKMLFLSLSLYSGFGICGTNALFFNVPRLLRRGCWSLLTPDTALMVIAGGIVFGQLLFVALVQRVNRRVLYITSGVMNFSVMTALAMYYQLIETSEWLSSICDFLPLLLFFFAWLSLMIGISSVPHLCLRELMTQDVIGIMMFTIDIFTPLACWLGFVFFELAELQFSLSAAFMVCASYSVFMIIVFYLYMPDTHGKLLEEIHNDFGVNVINESISSTE